jgi:hypothetical protein
VSHTFRNRTVETKSRSYLKNNSSIYDFEFLQNFDIDFDFRFLVFRTLGEGGALLFQKISKSPEMWKYRQNTFTSVGLWAAPAAKQRGTTPANLQF